MDGGVAVGTRQKMEGWAWGEPMLRASSLIWLSRGGERMVPIFSGNPRMTTQNHPTTGRRAGTCCWASLAPEAQRQLKEGALKEGVSGEVAGTKGSCFIW